MVIFDTIASKAVEEGIDAVRNKKEKETDADDLRQAEVPLSGSLAAGETAVVNFRSAEADTVLRSGYPFQSVDCYNASGQSIDIRVNQVEDLVLPVPDGAQNGDSFENVGVNSLEIVNKGGQSIDLDNVNLIVSGNPSGVARGSR